MSTSCVFLVGLSASSLYLLENRDDWFIAERVWDQNGGLFVSYLAYITGAKFERHHSNLS